MAATVTVTAPGPNKQVSLITNCRRRIVHVNIRPKVNLSRPDADGYQLHLLYTVSDGDDNDQLLGHTAPGGSSAQKAPFSVRFDAGTHALNYYGSLSMTGGNGEYEITISDGPLAHREPHWHWLNVYIGGPTTLPIPAQMHAVKAWRPIVGAQLNGQQIDIDHNPIPIFPGELTVPSAAVVCFGWYG